MYSLFPPTVVSSRVFDCRHVSGSTSSGGTTASLHPELLSLSTGDAHGTSTYSMSLCLATKLHERDTSMPNRLRSSARPPRFESLTSETMSNGAPSHASAIYTTVQALPTSTVMSSAGNAYLNLAEKIKDIGFNNILSIAKKSGAAPAVQDPVEIGLNTIMNIRRNRGRSSRVICQTPGDGDPLLQNKPAISTVISRQRVLGLGGRPTCVHRDTLPVKEDNISIGSLSSKLPHSSYQGTVPELVLTQCSTRTDAGVSVVTLDTTCHLSPTVAPSSSPEASERPSASILKKLSSLNLISSRPRCATGALCASPTHRGRNQP